MLALVSSIFNLQLVWIWSNITKIFIQGRIVKISLKTASEYRCLIIVPGNINMCMRARACVCIYIYTYVYVYICIHIYIFIYIYTCSLLEIDFCEHGIILFYDSLKTWQFFSQICRLFLTISSHLEYLKYIHIILYMLIIIIIKLYNNNNNAVL